MALGAALVWELRTTGSDTLCSGGFAGGALVATPSAPSVAGLGTGGTVAANTYYCVITLTDQYGETSQSAETSVVLTGTTSKFTVTAPANAANVVAWNLYVGTASGGPYWPQGTLLVLGTNRVVTTTPPTSGTQAPGTDYSKADSAHVTLDLVTITAVVAATTSNLTLVGYSTSAADVGNTVNITGGTATAGIYQIIGFSGTNTWILDRSAGTAAQTVTGVMGGGWATWAKAVNGAHLVNGNSVWMKTGTYTVTTAQGIANVNNLRVQGYNATRGDTGSPPLLTTATNSTVLINTASASWWSVTNVSFSNTAGTRAKGIDCTGNTAGAVILRSCIFDGFTIAINGSIVSNFPFAGLIQGCEFKNQSGTGKYVYLGNGAVHFLGNYFHGNAGQAINFDGTGPFVILNNVFSGNGTDILGNGAQFGCGLVVQNNVFISSTSDSINLTVTNCPFILVNNIFVSAGGYALNYSSGANTRLQSIQNNAFYLSTTGNYSTGANAVLTHFGDILLTANPFTNSAGGDYSLNNTAGGGALCRAAGIPSSWPVLSTTSYHDVGAAQTQSLNTTSYFPIAPGTSYSEEFEQITNLA